MSTSVHLDVRDGVAWVVLDGEATRNSLDLESAAALVEACDRIDTDTEIGAAVVTGAGSAFCSGASRSALTSLSSASCHEAYEALDTLYSAFTRFGSLRVPTLAAVNGAAVGAGLNLALAADVRIAAEEALFVSGFSELGIHPGGGHFFLLERAGGRSTAAALGLFAQRLSAREAAQCGLVWRVVPHHALLESATEVAAPAAADPALARATKASLDQTSVSSQRWSAAVEIERARQLWSLTRSH